MCPSISPSVRQSVCLLVRLSLGRTRVDCQVSDKYNFSGELEHETMPESLNSVGPSHNSQYNFNFIKRSSWDQEFLAVKSDVKSGVF